LINKLTISDILNRLPSVVDAHFNYYENQHDPLCHPKTRVKALEKINKWIHEQDQSYLFWLNGLAGTGKSTIARTIARQCSGKGYLGASFFFSRSGGDVGTARKFVTSIARQLTDWSSVLKGHIYQSLQQHQDIANHSLRDQWN
jgi:hypothetical protein